MAWTTVHELAKGLILEKDDRFEDRPSTQEDFAQLVPIVDLNFGILVNKVKDLPQFSLDRMSLDEKSALVSLILACGEHSECKPWTSNFSTESSSEILTLLSTLGSLSKMNDLVSNASILKLLLNSICPKMAPNSWKSMPATVHCFGWILMQIESPNFGEHLPRIFPAILVVLDDWQVEHKILGCQLMGHLINNVTRADLQRQQFDDVVFDILQRLIYEREAELVIEVVKCLSSLVSKVDHKYNQPFEMGRYDKALKVLLCQMELEQGLKLRKAYVMSLPLYLEAGSVCLMLWSQRILRIVSEYTTIEDESGGVTQMCGLEALLVFLKKTWPRANSYANQALTIVLRLLMNVTKAEPSIKVEKDNKSRILELLQQCLQFLSTTAPEQYRELMDGVDQVPASEEFHAIVNSVGLSSSKVM